ncbi:MAG: tRNA dimethylallyltransferase [Bacteroides sp. SM23_62_1]|nr:MAG: tRNA dimethylallyltransferase [Bacteroides sp. SM23_62_1]
MKNKSLIIILGPTAVGKTETSIKIAQTFNTEIISADSRQIYKEIKIGTGAPDETQLARIKHHFIHHISIHDYYNVSTYEVEVLTLIEKLRKKYNCVILTGGSGMYIDVICHGIDDLPPVDPDVRKELIEKHDKEGIESLRFELKRIDPDYYAKVDLQNPKRIMKALEVYYQTGIPYSSFLTRPQKKRPFNIIKIGLMLGHQELYARINKRVDMMISQGLADEAKNLIQYKHLNALKTVGYKEIFEYLDNNINLEKAIELIKRNTRHYARRQLTWFKRDKSITWFHPGEIDHMIEFINRSI